MIETILIDDEADGREALKLAIERYCPDITLLGEYATPEAGLEAIKTLRPDLVFLDVQMPGMSGFDLLQKVSPVTFEVIFVSAYDRYAIKAIKFSALDYLLKPIDIDELIQAVNRAKTRMDQKQSHFPVQSILNNIQTQSGKIERLAVPSLEGIDFFDTEDIIFCKADGNYTLIFLTNQQTKMVSRNLKDFENLLSDSGFCRVHHSFLINLRHVQRYIKGEGGFVILTDEHHVDISRRKKEEFLALLDRL
ncbi:MAG: LytTR family DNA-binding domain-containing protein [Bacteroidia bacterium]|nr:LytTR family DNA-binding domain-containing protein [Bacteroidia bacterium]